MKIVKPKDRKKYIIENLEGVSIGKRYTTDYIQQTLIKNDKQKYKGIQRIK